MKRGLEITMIPLKEKLISALKMSEAVKWTYMLQGICICCKQQKIQVAHSEDLCIRCNIIYDEYRWCGGI